MKRHSRGEKNRRRLTRITIGIDLGDRTPRCCAMEQGEVVEERSVAVTRKGLTQAFGARRRAASRWKWGRTRHG